ncbi:unnamed protein product, partial [Iphiclides podalirius]
MSDYERIKANCLQRRELWEDPDFPAIQNSVFYYQVPPFTFEWRRAKELYGNPTFILDNCNTFDVVSGRLGDKWLLSCVGVLYLCKGLFYRVVPSEQKIDSSYAGIFRFRLWWCGQWVEVLVDDRLPTVHGQLAFMHSSHTEQLWPALLEKAYAKMHGSYEALKYGNLLDGLADLTGGITESMILSEFGEAHALSSLMKASSIVTACRLLQSITHNLTTIESGMNYRVYAIEKVDSKEGPLHLVRLGKPPASGDSQLSHLVLDQAKWALIPEHERDRLASYNKGFWMLFSDFKDTFTRLEMVHLDAESSKAETSLSDKLKWQEANFSLRIYSMKPLKMTVLDCAPQMLKAALIKAPASVELSSFAQYESQFLQLADEHKTINAFELQELLERCLPNDYIKSCATIETCRQIVLSMEKDGTGRITLSDFKDLICSLKHWQIVFREHAPEKMGVLRAERLRDALREVGFVVPERALALLVLKYMRKDGMLRFGDFVSAVVLLHRAFMVEDGLDVLTLKNPSTE